jgi:16S rRNA (cytosine1407-C5)-methyltransferase
MKKIPELKPLFIERMKELLGKDFDNYLEILKKLPVKSIRCNKLKISPKGLKKKLEDKGWKIKQLWRNYPEVMIVESDLDPGELGRAMEHLLGYYYIQELSSMLPVIALKPEENEIILDLCSAPGSKTTQIASKMKNTGTIISNDVSLGRIKILASNLERCGVTNTIITKKEGIALCKKLKREDFEFDKILVDAPCSGEGTLRSSPKTYSMWNIKTVKSLSRLQKNLFISAFEILKIGGEIIYSTCTHAPEENEEVVNFILEEFKDKIKIQKIFLPIRPREGITKWKDKRYSKEIKKTCRIYPHDNDTEGFFLAKFRRVK